MLRDPVQLSRWLVLVASLRAFSTICGYISPAVLQNNLFVGAHGSYTPLAGRTFSVWTAVTCSSCLIAASHADSIVALEMCALTFVLAIIYFSLEVVVYRTISVAAAAPPFVIASTFNNQKLCQR